MDFEQHGRGNEFEYVHDCSDNSSSENGAKIQVTVQCGGEHGKQHRDIDGELARRGAYDYGPACEPHREWWAIGHVQRDSDRNGTVDLRMDAKWSSGGDRTPHPSGLS